MQVRKVVVFAVAALFLGMTGLVSAQANAAENNKKTVTVNIQDVLLSSAAGQDVKKALEEKVAGYQEKFQKEQEEVDALRAEIDKKGSVWSKEVKEEKERDYQKRVRELQVKSEDAQFELQQMEKQVMGPVLNELQKIIKDEGLKKGYGMIIDSRAGLLYVDPTLDISEDIKKELDARQKSGMESKGAK